MEEILDNGIMTNIAIDVSNLNMEDVKEIAIVLTPDWAVKPSACETLKLRRH